MANFKAKVRAVLDPSSVNGFTSQLEAELSKASIHVSKFDVSGSDIRSQIEKELSKPFDIKINAGANSSAANAGKQAGKDFMTAFNGVQLQGNHLKNTRDIMTAWGFDPAAIDKATKSVEDDLKRLNLQIVKIQNASKGHLAKDGSPVAIDALRIQAKDQAGNLVNLYRAFDDSGKVKSWSDDVTQSFEKQATAAKSTSVEFEKLKKLQKDWSSAKLELAKIDPKTDASYYSTVANQLETARKAYKDFYDTTKSKNNGQDFLTSDQKNTIKENFQSTLKQFNDIQEKIQSKAVDVQRRAIESLNSNLGPGKSITSSFEKTIQDYNKLSSSSTELEASIIKLRDAYNDMNSSPDDGKRLEAQKLYNEALKESNAEIARITKQEKEYIRNDTLQNRAQTIISNTQDWLNKNPRAAAAYGNEINTIIAQLKDPALSGEAFSNLTSQLNAYKAAAKEAGLTTSPLVQNLKQLLGIGSALAIMRKGIQTVKQMAQETIKVDTAMTELYRVTNLSDAQYSNLYDNMTNSAKAYGAELDTMINSTASWVRLGFDANTANKLAEVSTMYQHVTDLDEKTAVNNLVTAYMGFKDSLLEVTNGDEVAAITRISDVFDKLGNELPVKASDVATGMEKNASVLQSAGASFEQAAAMVVGSGSVSQDFARSGTALKVFSMRVRGMKGELEELGEDVDDNVQSVSKMQTQILNLTKGAVNIFEADGKTFRNIYDIAKELAEVLPTLDETDQAALLETVAGKSRSNDILNLLTNFEMTEKALKAAENAAGTAAKENAIYMDSIQGRLDSLKASYQALSADFIQSDFLKVLVTGATGFLDVLDAIASKLGTVRTLLAGGSIFAGIKAFQSIS